LASSAVALYGSSTLFAGFVNTVALSFASSLLGPKVPKAQNTSGYDLSGVAPAADHAIVYGRQKVGGVIVFKETTRDNKDLQLIIALAGHEIESVEEVYLNDEQITLAALSDGVQRTATAPEQYQDKVYVTAHLGSDDQSVDTNLSSESAKWDSTHRMQGIAYLYIKLEFDQDSFPQGEPSISAVVKGKKVYNPNTAVTEWTDNAAYILRDYLMSDYGLEAETTEIDNTSFISAGNICDWAVVLAGWVGLWLGTLSTDRLLQAQHQKPLSRK